MFCRNCGAKLENSYSYCYECGTKVETVNNQYATNNSQANISTPLPPKKGKKGLICILSSFGLFFVMVMIKLVLGLAEVQINDIIYTLMSIVQVYGAMILLIVGIILAILKK